jgi:hypothetical protein
MSYLSQIPNLGFGNWDLVILFCYHFIKLMSSTITVSRLR